MSYNLLLVNYLLITITYYNKLENTKTKCFICKGVLKVHLVCITVFRIIFTIYKCTYLQGYIKYSY